MEENYTELYKTVENDTISSMVATEDLAQLSNAIDILVPEAFGNGVNRVIFQSICRVVAENNTFSVEEMVRDLEEEGHLKDVGGYQALFALLEKGRKKLYKSPATSFAFTLRQLHVKREISEFLKKNKGDFLEDSGTSPIDGATKIQEYLNASIFDLSNDKQFVIDVQNSYEKYKETLAKREEKASEGSLIGIPSLLPTLDKYTTGWNPGQMITVGARTGVGKTVFGLNCATAAASAGKSVMFFSLEMSVEENLDRIYASISGIPINVLKSGQHFDDDTAQKLASAGKEFESWKLKIDTNPDTTIDTIRSKAIEYSRTNGLDFIIIDYIGLIRITNPSGNRQTDIQNLSRNIKKLAQKLGIPIMVLVQLNRKRDDEESGMPDLSKIRESGAIAQDSDIIIILHREESEEGSNPPTIIYLNKNRNGPGNKYIACHSNLSTATFIEKRKMENAEEDDDVDSHYAEIEDFYDPDEDTGEQWEPSSGDNEFDYEDTSMDDFDFGE